MTNPTSEDAPPPYEDPEPGRWTIDPVHSFVSFGVLHMNVSYARGMAVGPAGTITIAPRGDARCRYARTFGDTPSARLRISRPPALLSCESVRRPSRGLRTLGEAGLG